MLFIGHKNSCASLGMLSLTTDYCLRLSNLRALPHLRSNPRLVAQQYGILLHEATSSYFDIASLWWFGESTALSTSVYVVDTREYRVDSSLSGTLHVHLQVIVRLAR
jgi:hypothetical protein